MEKENNKKQKKKRTTGDVIRTVIMVIALLVFLFSAYQLIKIFLEYKAGTDEYEGLRKFITTETESQEETTESKESNDTEKEEETDEALNWTRLQVDFDSLTAINSDIIGWIQMEAIEEINYPIVQAQDNDKYLKSTFEGNQNSAGAIFMDYMNNSHFTDDNTFIYGHNMRNGSMFGNLKEFHDKSTYEESPYFWIYTPEADYRYEIFSYHVADVSDSSFNISFEDDTQFQEYIDKMYSLSEYDTGVTVTSNDRIVTLSTCTGDDSTRFLVHGVLVKVYAK